LKNMKTSEDLPDYVLECAQLAAALEVSGYPKPGNVHRTADFDDLRFEDFLSSSIALGPPIRRLTRRGLNAFRGRLPLNRIHIGEAVKEAVDETTSWQKGGNTHLGTILLFAPLAAAAGLCGSIRAINSPNLRRAVGEILRATTVKDAVDAFESIAKTTPQTLGKLSDMSAPDLSTIKCRPVQSTTLLEAMRHSSKWDGVASEWSTSFEKVFVVGYPELLEVFGQTRDVNIATVHTFLFLLSHFPDTFMARKIGLKRTPYIEDAVEIGSEETRWVADSAREAIKLGGLTTLEGRASIQALDNRLRSGQGLNPGTTADLTGASLMVALLCGWRF
jgi:triphosphoribosyl-dephospho-CoA synthase